MACVRPHITTLVACILGFICFILQLIGLVAPAWFFVRLGEKGEARVGLWDYCYEQPKYDCEGVGNHFVIESYWEATRAFAMMGFLSLCLCVGSSVCIFVLSHIDVFADMAPASALVSVICIFFEWAIFCGSIERVRNSVGQDFQYDYAFAMTISAFILLVPTTFLFFYGNIKAVELRPPPTIKYRSSKSSDRGSEHGTVNTIGSQLGEVRSVREGYLNRSQDFDRERSWRGSRDLNRSRESREFSRNRDLERAARGGGVVLDPDTQVKELDRLSHHSKLSNV